MDGRITDGRKGIPYLRDLFTPAVLAELTTAFDDEATFAPDRAERASILPAPV